MSFSYSPLWLTLAKRGLSKTDFRLKTGISTATLAKLSANQQISLEVIGKICDSLNCRMDEVITYQSESEGTNQWHTLLQNATYHISLWFLEEHDTFTYIYGYAVPHPTTFSASKWQLEKSLSEDDLTIWNVCGFTDSVNTRQLIQYVESNHTFGDYMKDSQIDLSHARKAADINAVCRLQTTLLGSRNQCCRPAILLEPAMHTAKLLPEFQPFHSYDESEPMICESITCLDKSTLYETNGVKDYTKMKILHRFFREYHFLAGGIRDIGRIGNFELFSWLSGTQESDNIFSFEVLKEKNASKKSSSHLSPVDQHISGIRVTLHHHYLDGDYLLEAEAWNANNRIIKEIRLITCSGQDILQTFPLHEACSEVCISLWKMNGGTAGELIGTQHVPLMRDIYIKTSITEKSGKIKDSWTSITPEKDRPNRNTDFKHHASQTSHIGSSESDPWRPEIQKVFQDFNKIYGSEFTESKFFPEGWESHEEFLTFFKTLLSKNEPERVMLIDPHIDEQAITRFLRSIEEVGCYYDIITDFKAGRTPAEKRIPALKKSCAELRGVLPRNFTITGFHDSKLTLHDRYLILQSADERITVYQMSNSLDNAATRHAFSVAKCTRYTSRQIYEYYQKLVYDAKCSGTLEVIFDNTAQDTSHSSDIEDPHKKRTEFLRYYDQLLSDAHLPKLILSEQDHICFDKNQEEGQLCCITASALTSWEPVGTFLACVIYPYSERIKEILREKHGAQLVPVLSDYINSASLETSLQDAFSNKDYEYYIAVSLGQTLQNADFPKLLEIAKALLDNRYHLLSYCGSYAFTYALELLVDLSLPEFERCFRNYLEKKQQPFAELTCALFAVQLVKSLEYHDSVAELLAKNLLTSALPVLRCIGIQWYIRHHADEPEPFVTILQNISDCEEKNYAMSSMAVHLQVEVCRHKQEPDKWQELLDCLINLWPSLLPAHMSKDDTAKYFSPMEFRSISDVCRLVRTAYTVEKMDAETAAEYLTNLAFQKSSDAQSEKNVYFKVSDLQDCAAVLEILYELDPEYVFSFFQRMTTLVKRILPDLRKPFFRSMNYRLWKQLIDLLCWCCCVREITLNGLKKGEKTDTETEVLFSQTEPLFREADIVLENHSQTLMETSELYRYYRR